MSSPLNPVLAHVRLRLMHLRGVLLESEEDVQKKAHPSRGNLDPEQIAYIKRKCEDIYRDRAIIAELELVERVILHQTGGVS